MKKILPIFIIAVIVVGAGAFYSGMKYGQNQRKQTQKFQAANAGGGMMKNNRLGGGGGGKGDFSTGEIIAKDDKSITLKMGDSGSKIIFFSDSTKIEKFTQGTVADLAIGKTIVATGKANPDGSITAQSIQLRPEMPKDTPVK